MDKKIEKSLNYEIRETPEEKEMFDYIEEFWRYARGNLVRPGFYNSHLEKLSIN